MSDKIKKLPSHVASQIAAGEVVQRPASLVKELLDNAIDATASQIQVLIKDAGKELVQVIDNGMGMSEADAVMCWERHATSKISKTEDIFKVLTMGFRGEALASIASVARVEMKTKTEQDELGTEILLEGSKIISKEKLVCETGTSIAVKNLFFNIPARRNFLKSNTIEFRHIFDEFNRSAIAYPEIQFELFQDDKKSIVYHPSSLLARINTVVGLSENDWMEINEETSILKITGYCSAPEKSKKSRGDQYFFVNNRYFKDASFNHAVMSAYEGLISSDTFPAYVLKIEIDPAMVDVNVHPTKTEVKFEDDKNCYQIIRAVVRKAIMKAFGGEQISNWFDDNKFVQDNINGSVEDAFNFKTQASETVGTGVFSALDSFKYDYQQKRNEVQRGWEQLFPKSNETTNNIFESNSTISAAKQFFQIHNQYIVTQIKRGLMLVDQQAAHERVLFEKYQTALANKPVSSQQLLFPKTIHLSVSDEIVLLEIIDDIHQLGFHINHFGKQTFVVNGLPAELHLLNEQQLIEEVIEAYKAGKQAETHKKDLIARTLAAKASIKAGTSLSADEMNSLIDDLFACAEPLKSPHGKTCVKMLSLEDIAKLFDHKI